MGARSPAAPRQWKLPIRARRQRGPRVMASIQWISCPLALRGGPSPDLGPPPPPLKLPTPHCCPRTVTVTPTVFPIVYLISAAAAATININHHSPLAGYERGASLVERRRRP